MRKYLILILAICLLFGYSCSKDDDCVNGDVLLQLWVVDENGNDLLNPDETFPKSIDMKRALVDNKAFQVWLDKESGRYYSHQSSMHEKSVIDWYGNGVDTDTITAVFKHFKCLFICTELFLNGNKVWSVHDNRRREITIVR